MAGKQSQHTKEFTIVRGNKEKKAEKRFATSEIYFSNRIFNLILEQLSVHVDTFKGSTLPFHGNYFRRGTRLLDAGKLLLEKAVCKNKITLHSSPVTEVYEYLEELYFFFRDTGARDLSENIFEIITNEVISEIVTTLAVRPGRQTSATVLAIHYGLLEPVDVSAVMEALSIDSVEKYLYSAHLDIEEIAEDLQFKGDYKKILELAQERLAA